MPRPACMPLTSCARNASFRPSSSASPSPTAQAVPFPGRRWRPSGTACATPDRWLSVSTAHWGPTSCAPLPRNWLNWRIAPCASTRMQVCRIRSARMATSIQRNIWPAFCVSMPRPVCSTLWAVAAARLPGTLPLSARRCRATPRAPFPPMCRMAPCA